MNKRGITPLIATALLIVIVVVLAFIVFFWARGFLTESAQKNDRAVEISCANAKFEAEIIQSASNCQTQTGRNSAVDINNLGNIPIYGIQVLEYNPTTGNVNVEPLAEHTFTGTITIGKSASVCLGRTVAGGNSFKIVPKLLAQREQTKIVYTCPENSGLGINYQGI